MPFAGYGFRLQGRAGDGGDLRLDVYTTLTNEEFLGKCILYTDLPLAQKAICDAHPSYDEWVEQMNREHGIDRPQAEETALLKS